MARVVKHATITAGEALSDAVDISHAKGVLLHIPSTWGTAGLSFQAEVGGGKFAEVYKADGSTPYGFAAAPADGTVQMDMDVIGAADLIKIRSGTALSAVTQSGEEAKCTVTLSGTGDTAKTLTFTSGVGGPDANNLTVTLETADDDTLAATIDGYDLTVKLASQTADKNTDELIEDAVQALANTGSVDLTTMTVVGNDAYDAAEPVGTVASKVITVATGKTLTFATILKGAQYNDITVTMETAEDDTLAVSKIEGTDGILIKLANTTANKNAAAAIQTALQTVAATDASAFDISGMTVTGNATYNSAPLAGVKASKTIAIDGDKTLTFTSGVGGAASNAIKITIGVNDDDKLSVSAADGVITILLADTTGSNNAAAAIEAAIRAIEGGEVAGVAITGMTVTGSTEYDAAPPVALGAEVEISEVPLAGGADSIASGVVEDVALAGGTDSVTAGLIDHVPFSGGKDCIIGVVIKE
jgi:hypothetical protein